LVAFLPPPMPLLDVTPAPVPEAEAVRYRRGMRSPRYLGGSERSVPEVGR
jgi:hypothetical protein